MGTPAIVKYISLVLSCPSWFSFYAYVNAYIRTCVLCFETIKNGKNTLFQVLAAIFFFFCCSLIQFIFCVMGFIYLFDGPCQTFVQTEDSRKGYLELVKGDNFPIADTVRGIVQGIFC